MTTIRVMCVILLAAQVGLTFRILYGIEVLSNSIAMLRYQVEAEKQEPGGSRQFDIDLLRSRRTTRPRWGLSEGREPFK